AKHLGRRPRGDNPDPGGPRRRRPGTVLVREYQGERHTVTVGPGGYVWREAAYASLYTSARASTGTAWSGPRFFGLRAGVNRREDIEGEGVVGTHAGSTDTSRSRRRDGSVSAFAGKVRR